MEQTRSGAFLSTTNLHNILGALAVASFLLSPAFADASASGAVYLPCMYGDPSCSPIGVGYVTNSFSFSGTNQSGQASVTGSFGQTLTEIGLVQQTAAETPNGFAIDLLSQFTSSPVAGGGWAVDETLSDYFAIGFNLTTASSMHLTGALTADGSGEFFFQFADFWGPGGFFMIPFGPIDETVTLVPGVYLLEFDASGSLQHGPAGGYDFGFDDSLELSLNAEFTAIPEPHWTAIVLGLIGVGCCLVGQGRRCAC